MRRLTALAGLFLVGFLGVAAAAPGTDLGLPIPAITTTSHAQAAIGRGGGGGSEGGQPGVLKRLGGLFQEEFAGLFFILVAIGLAVLIGQRNAGAAVGLLVAAFVIGAFLLVPNQVESLFRSVYNYVL
ncbi:MAG TPA: hypothetical protein VG448_06075 [Solirubrobacterales bacterium]|nr:hypothetical protein [Solirubrobacterales bacterium]